MNASAIEVSFREREHMSGTAEYQRAVREYCQALGNAIHKRMVRMWKEHHLPKRLRKRGRA